MLLGKPKEKEMWPVPFPPLLSVSPLNSFSLPARHLILSIVLHSFALSRVGECAGLLSLPPLVTSPLPLRSFFHFSYLLSPPSLSQDMVFQGQDAWRNLPAFQGLWKQAFTPGLKYGALAFGVYVVVETVYDFATKPKAQPAPKAHAAGESPPTSIFRVVVGFLQ